MKPGTLFGLKAIILAFALSLITTPGITQHFYITADLGGGQATGEYDHHEFAFTSDIGVGYETKSHIISISGKLKTESFNFNEELDLMVFSLPVGCEIYPRFNPRPFAGITLAPCYATQWLVERDFFLTCGFSGGIIYEFPRLSCFAQYEYLADITGYSHNQTAIQNVDRYYLNRYYVSIGVRVSV